MKNIFTLFLLLIVQAKPKSTAQERVREFVRDAIESNDVVAFTKSYCPYSHRARKALASTDIEFKYYDINRLPDMELIQDELYRLTGARTVPRVFIHQKFYGGGDDTAAGVRSGEVQKLVEAGKN